MLFNDIFQWLYVFYIHELFFFLMPSLGLEALLSGCSESHSWLLKWSSDLCHGAFQKHSRSNHSFFSINAFISFLLLDTCDTSGSSFILRNLQRTAAVKLPLVFFRALFALFIEKPQVMCQI